jgi:hypothetical protein
MRAGRRPAHARHVLVIASEQRAAPVSVRSEASTETGARNRPETQQPCGFQGITNSAKAPQKRLLRAQKWLAHHLAEPSRKGRLAA